MIKGERNFAHFFWIVYVTDYSADVNAFLNKFSWLFYRS